MAVIWSASIAARAIVGHTEELGSSGTSLSTLHGDLHIRSHLRRHDTYLQRKEGVFPRGRIIDVVFYLSWS